MVHEFTVTPEDNIRDLQVRGRAMHSMNPKPVHVTFETQVAERWEKSNAREEIKTIEKELIKLCCSIYNPSYLLKQSENIPKWHIIDNGSKHEWDWVLTPFTNSTKQMRRDISPYFQYWFTLGYVYEWHVIQKREIHYIPLKCTGQQTRPHYTSEHFYTFSWNGRNK